MDFLLSLQLFLKFGLLFALLYSPFSRHWIVFFLKILPKAHLSHHLMFFTKALLLMPMISVTTFIQWLSLDFFPIDRTVKLTAYLKSSLNSKASSNSTCPKPNPQSSSIPNHIFLSPDIPCLGEWHYYWISCLEKRSFSPHLLSLFYI